MAGYSKKTVGAIAAGNLQKPQIRAYIAELYNEAKTERIADAQEVLETLTRILRREEVEWVVLKIKTRVTGVDENGEKKTTETEESKLVSIPAKLSDVNKAADMLARRYALYTANQVVDTEDIEASRKEVYDDE